MDDGERPISSGAVDPGASAAAMLLRFGFAIFALVLPSATLMSRWVIVVLVPIGAVLIILSALLKDDPSRIWRGARDLLGSMGGIAALLFAMWAVASLLWTPVPGEAAEKLFKALGILVLGLLAVSALPRRMRATNLHLVTIGVAIGAVLILGAEIAEVAGGVTAALPAATPGRVAVMLSVLVWLGAAWMLIKNRPKLALGLLVLVALAVALGPGRDAIMPLVLSVLVAGLAWNAPDRVGKAIAAGIAAVVLAMPVIALLASLAPKIGGLPSLGLWWSLIAADPLRFITGHGFDAANAARAVGIIPGEARVSLVTDIWFDLGVLGAVGLAAITYLGFRTASELGLDVAPAALAAMTAGTAYAVLERGATQTWWLNGMTVAAIMLVSIGRGRYRTVRPRALVKRRATAETTEPAIDAPASPGPNAL